ncbi:MAG: RagB/SusD family nutrient uptake outer membrane protein [Bacteroidota bacterium]|nr:RagB/SusD family nutrient uptake outer membrane protein [Bacteroidota bacterium]
MINYNHKIKFGLLFIAVGIGFSCTKLKENLSSTLTNAQVVSSFGSNGPQLILSGAYADLTFLAGQDQLFSLEENSSDESLVPTRGGDWDDNGVWRVIHNHTWNADHGQILSTFNSLNKLNFDATNVLGFNPTPSQAAQAKVLRAFALYYLLDLYGQYPIRNPGDNLLLAPTVRSGVAGMDSVIADITSSIPNLPAPGNAAIVNSDVAKVLLMKCYLQKGTIANRAAPTFDPADLARVITLGNGIIASKNYSYMANYFANFNPTNHSSSEAIWLYPNTSGVSTNHAGTEARWNMTLHYNSFKAKLGGAGWNGFSTISDFYSSFNTGGGAVTFGPKDTIWDTRLGERTKSDSISWKISGIKPGFLVGQQYDGDSTPQKDRKNNPLAFIPAISPNMIEQGNLLELTGIRVVKYAPDFSGSGYPYYGGPAGNDLMIFRYPDVVLMVAEAMMRINPADPAALVLVNGLRVARGAPVFTTLPLVNPSNVEDPNTLLAERGREFYWESFRRTDMLRFGVFLKIWQYKPTDDPKNLVYPIPSQALAANPNLTQNPGY